MPNPDETRYKIISGVATALIMALTVVICLAFGYMPPDPPIPEEGVEVNLGNSETGFGESQQIDGGTASASEQASSAEEDLSSQSTEESVALPTKANTKPSKTQQEQPKETPKQETKPAEPVINQNALFKKRGEGNNNGGSEGNTSGAGNMGSKDGNPNASGYNGNSGGGKGVSFSLVGRGKVKLVEPPYNSEAQGKIVIQIYVDRKGNVIAAENTRGTDIRDQALVDLCIAKAKESKFSSSETAPDKQKGTITYVFRRD